MAISAEQKMDILVSLCKRRGFVYPDSEIYGGFANAWDYGPYGVELRNNIRDAWWRRFVQRRDDVVGVDTPIIQHPKVWQASLGLGGKASCANYNAWKRKLKAKAQELYPHLDVTLKNADALLILHYAMGGGR